MIKVIVRVDGEVPLSVAIMAESIRAAVGIVQARYPDAEARVAYPIDPDSFFAGDPVAAVRMDGLEVEAEADSPADGSRHRLAHRPSDRDKYHGRVGA